MKKKENSSWGGTKEKEVMLKFTFLYIMPAKALKIITISTEEKVFSVAENKFWLLLGWNIKLNEFLKYDKINDDHSWRNRLCNELHENKQSLIQGL